MQDPKKQALNRQIIAEHRLNNPMLEKKLETISKVSVNCTVKEILLNEVISLIPESDKDTAYKVIIRLNVAHERNFDYLQNTNHAKKSNYGVVCEWGKKVEETTFNLLQEFKQNYSDSHTETIDALNNKYQKLVKTTSTSAKPV